MSENLTISSDELCAVMIILDDLTKNSIFLNHSFVYDGANMPPHVFELLVSANTNFQNILSQRKNNQ